MGDIREGVAEWPPKKNTKKIFMPKRIEEG
jgi:hypothetical protein